MTTSETVILPMSEVWTAPSQRELVEAFLATIGEE
jgi:hypothetical protein